MHILLFSVFLSLHLYRYHIFYIFILSPFLHFYLTFLSPSILFTFSQNHLPDFIFPCLPSFGFLRLYLHYIFCIFILSPFHHPHLTSLSSFILFVSSQKILVLHLSLFSLFHYSISLSSFLSFIFIQHLYLRSLFRFLTKLFSVLPFRYLLFSSSFSCNSSCQPSTSSSIDFTSS